jgi:hypothetical protein
VAAEPEPVITWETRPAPALDFTVNFGVFAGREVSRRELERLSHALLPIVPTVSIAEEHRFEVGTDASVALHLVRVEISKEALSGAADVETIRDQVAAALTAWLEDCLTNVSGQELTDAELRARDAVVEGVLAGDA